MLRWTLTVVASIVAVATFAGVIFFALALIDGKPLQTTLGLVLDNGHPYSVVASASDTAVGSLTANRATLSVRAGGVAYLLTQGLDIVLTGGLWIMVLLALRRLAGAIALGRPFEKENIIRLRKIGWALLALGAWSWLRVLLLPLALLHTIRVAGSRIAILPAISSGVPGMLAARVEARLDVGLPIAGLLVLVLAEAFIAGLALREDNEAIL